ncbi:MAG: Ser/Thr protein kinase RdoA (MazF antagonist) [Candidatus Poriferisodalaceae bacterium]
MTPFGQLSPVGRARRLRRFATDVVSESYGRADASVRLLSAHSFNTVFAVRHGGERLVLRVGDAVQIHSSGVEEVEARWLRSLAEAGVSVAQNIPTRDGGVTAMVESPDVPGARVCTLFSCVDGVPLSQRLDADRISQAGALLSLLHENSRVTGELPPDVHADRAVYLPAVDRNALPAIAGHDQLFAEATERAQVAVDELWASSPHEPHLLHGDFGPHNILSRRGDLRPIDFQDLQFGFDVQDLGISFADLSRRDPAFVEPFQLGYSSVRPWPDLTPELLASFSAARRV